MTPYKANVGDFPLKVHPCKYWWVRYAVACTYFNEQQEKLLKAYVIEANLPEITAYGGGSNNRRIWVNELQNMDDKDMVKQDTEEYKKLNDFITKYYDHDGEERIGWFDCPFENLDQSKCPFYEPEPHYKDKPLEELKERKGYDV